MEWSSGQLTMNRGNSAVRSHPALIELADMFVLLKIRNIVDDVLYEPLTQPDASIVVSVLSNMPVEN